MIVTRGLGGNGTIVTRGLGDAGLPPTYQIRDLDMGPRVFTFELRTSNRINKILEFDRRDNND